MTQKNTKQHPAFAEGLITRLSHDGRGIASLAGKTTFVSNGLPGEHIRFRYTKQRSQFDEGIATEILNPSPARETPFCPHFNVCGGCSLQHISAATQIEIKQTALLDLLKHQAKITPKKIIAPITANTHGYRRKARLGVKWLTKHNKLLIGFREKNARFIADLAQCKVLHASIGEKIETLKAMILKLSIANLIPQIEIAVDDENTALIIRHLHPFAINDYEVLSQFGEKNNYKIYLQPKGIDSIHLYYPPHANLEMHYSILQGKLKFFFKPWQFTQINFEINHQMVQQALHWLDLKENDCVLDLFCGIGNFTLPLALSAKIVIGVEGDQTAVTQARTNADYNKITNTEFYCDNLFEPVEHKSWAQHSFNKLLLDPPRSGAKELLSNLKWRPEKIIYISCNPATFARDAALLVAQGYQLEHIGVLDMFPHTQHVETMALFELG